ncbi:MAG: ThuA domain-containing protein [Planctomycetaceae bacterium]|nr:MAG: ThuA domain-containing protein [Planctomycetaceae bacterium]
MIVVRSLTTLAAMLLLAVSIGLGEFARADEPLKLLIVDGQNNHNWKAMTPVMKAELEKTGRFKVDVVTTPENNAPAAEWARFRPDFGKYQVVLSNYNGQLWPEEVRVALVKWVGNGGGLVIIHAANNAFPEWPEWNRMIGLGWRDAGYGPRLTVGAGGQPVKTGKGQGPGAGHGPQHEYPIDIRDDEHPVTKGMPLRWMHGADELYHGQRGPAEEMRVLASAYSAQDRRGTGAHEPMIWWIPFGQGKVFTTVMGHVGGNDTRAIRCLGFIAVMNRGCEWAATGKVTIPLPENFPTTHEGRAIPEPK